MLRDQQDNRPKIGDVVESNIYGVGHVIGFTVVAGATFVIIVFPQLATTYSATLNDFYNLSIEILRTSKRFNNQQIEAIQKRFGLFTERSIRDAYQAVGQGSKVPRIPRLPGIERVAKEVARSESTVSSVHPVPLRVTDAQSAMNRARTSVTEAIKAIIEKTISEAKTDAEAASLKNIADGLSYLHEHLEIKNWTLYPEHFGSSAQTVRIQNKAIEILSLISPDEAIGALQLGDSEVATEHLTNLIHEKLSLAADSPLRQYDHQEIVDETSRTLREMIYWTMPSAQRESVERAHTKSQIAFEKLFPLAARTRRMPGMSEKTMQASRAVQKAFYAKLIASVELNKPGVAQRIVSELLEVEHRSRRDIIHTLHGLIAQNPNMFIRRVLRGANLHSLTPFQNQLISQLHDDYLPQIVSDYVRGKISGPSISASAKTTRRNPILREFMQIAERQIDEYLDNVYVNADYSRANLRPMDRKRFDLRRSIRSRPKSLFTGGLVRQSQNPLELIIRTPSEILSDFDPDQIDMMVLDLFDPKNTEWVSESRRARHLRGFSEFGRLQRKTIRARMVKHIESTLIRDYAQEFAQYEETLKRIDIVNRWTSGQWSRVPIAYREEINALNEALRLRAYSSARVHNAAYMSQLSEFRELSDDAIYGLVRAWKRGKRGDEFPLLRAQLFDVARVNEVVTFYPHQLAAGEEGFTAVPGNGMVFTIDDTMLDGLLPKGRASIIKTASRIAGKSAEYVPSAVLYESASAQNTFFGVDDAKEKMLRMLRHKTIVEMSETRTGMERGKIDPFYGAQRLKGFETVLGRIDDMLNISEGSLEGRVSTAWGRVLRGVASQLRNDYSDVQLSIGRSMDTRDWVSGQQIIDARDFEMMDLDVNRVALNIEDMKTDVFQGPPLPDVYSPHANEALDEAVQDLMYGRTSKRSAVNKYMTVIRKNYNALFDRPFHVPRFAEATIDMAEELFRLGRTSESQIRTAVAAQMQIDNMDDYKVIRESNRVRLAIRKLREITEAISPARTINIFASQYQHAGQATIAKLYGSDYLVTSQTLRRNIVGMGYLDDIPVVRNFKTGEVIQTFRGLRSDIPIESIFNPVNSVNTQKLMEGLGSVLADESDEMSFGIFEVFSGITTKEYKEMLMEAGLDPSYEYRVNDASDLGKYIGYRIKQGAGGPAQPRIDAYIKAYTLARSRAAVSNISSPGMANHLLYSKYLLRVLLEQKTPEEVTEAMQIINKNRRVSTGLASIDYFRTAAGIEDLLSELGLLESTIDLTELDPLVSQEESSAALDELDTAIEDIVEKRQNVIVGELDENSPLQTVTEEIDLDNIGPADEIISTPEIEVKSISGRDVVRRFYATEAAEGVSPEDLIPEQFIIRTMPGTVVERGAISEQAMNTIEMLRRQQFLTKPDNSPITGRQAIARLELMAHDIRTHIERILIVGSSSGSVTDSIILRNAARILAAREYIIPIRDAVLESNTPEARRMLHIALNIARTIINNPDSEMPPTLINALDEDSANVLRAIDQIAKRKQSEASEIIEAMRVLQVIQRTAESGNLDELLQGSNVDINRVSEYILAMTESYTGQAEFSTNRRLVANYRNARQQTMDYISRLQQAGVVEDVEERRAMFNFERIASLDLEDYRTLRGQLEEGRATLITTMNRVKDAFPSTYLDRTVQTWGEIAEGSTDDLIGLDVEGIRLLLFRKEQNRMQRGAALMELFEPLVVSTAGTEESKRYLFPINRSKVEAGLRRIFNASIHETPELGRPLDVLEITYAQIEKYIEAIDSTPDRRFVKELAKHKRMFMTTYIHANYPDGNAALERTIASITDDVTNLRRVDQIVPHWGTFKQLISDADRMNTLGGLTRKALDVAERAFDEVGSADPITGTATQRAGHRWVIAVSNLEELVDDIKSGIVVGSNIGGYDIDGLSIYIENLLNEGSRLPDSSTRDECLVSLTQLQSELSQLRIMETDKILSIGGISHPNQAALLRRMLGDGKTRAEIEDILNGLETKLGLETGPFLTVDSRLDRILHEPTADAVFHRYLASKALTEQGLKELGLTPEQAARLFSARRSILTGGTPFDIQNFYGELWGVEGLGLTNVSIGINDKTIRVPARMLMADLGTGRYALVGTFDTPELASKGLSRYSIIGSGSYSEMMQLANYSKQAEDLGTGVSTRALDIRSHMISEKLRRVLEGEDIDPFFKLSFIEEARDIISQGNNDDLRRLGRQALAAAFEGTDFATQSLQSAINLAEIARTNLADATTRLEIAQSALDIVQNTDIEPFVVDELNTILELIGTENVQNNPQVRADLEERFEQLSSEYPHRASRHAKREAKRHKLNLNIHKRAVREASAEYTEALAEAQFREQNLREITEQELRPRNLATRSEIVSALTGENIEVTSETGEVISSIITGRRDPGAITVNASEVATMMREENAATRELGKLFYEVLDDSTRMRLLENMAGKADKRVAESLMIQYMRGFATSMQVLATEAGLTQQRPGRNRFQYTLSSVGKKIIQTISVEKERTGWSKLVSKFAVDKAYTGAIQQATAQIAEANAADLMLSNLRDRMHMIQIDENGRAEAQRLIDSIQSRLTNYTFGSSAENAFYGMEEVTDEYLAFMRNYMSDIDGAVKEMRFGNMDALMERGITRQEREVLLRRTKAAVTLQRLHGIELGGAEDALEVLAGRPGFDQASLKPIQLRESISELLSASQKKGYKTMGDLIVALSQTGDDDIAMYLRGVIESGVNVSTERRSEFMSAMSVFSDAFRNIDGPSTFGLNEMEGQEFRQFVTDVRGLQDSPIMLDRRGVSAHSLANISDDDLAALQQMMERIDRQTTRRSIETTIGRNVRTLTDAIATKGWRYGMGAAIAYVAGRTVFPNIRDRDYGVPYQVTPSFDQQTTEMLNYVVGNASLSDRPGHKMEVLIKSNINGPLEKPDMFDDLHDILYREDYLRRGNRKLGTRNSEVPIMGRSTGIRELVG